MAGQPAGRRLMPNARHPCPSAPEGTPNPSLGIRNMTHCVRVCVCVCICMCGQWVWIVYNYPGGPARLTFPLFALDFQDDTSMRIIPPQIQ